MPNDKGKKKGFKERIGNIKNSHDSKKGSKKVQDHSPCFHTKEVAYISTLGGQNKTKKYTTLH